jgi:hypothetical protein
MQRGGSARLDERAKLLRGTGELLGSLGLRQKPEEGDLERQPTDRDLRVG